MNMLWERNAWKMIIPYEQFLSDYISDNLVGCTYLDEHTEINYSTVGYKKGKKDIVEALRLNGSYRHRYNILANPLQYTFEGEDIVLVKGFHFIAKESSSFNVASATSEVKGQIHPLIFGGTYKFYFNKDINKFSKIEFQLEAEYGNTYWAKSIYHYKLMRKL